MASDNAYINKLGGSKIASSTQSILNKNAGDSGYSGTAQSAINQYLAPANENDLSFLGGKVRDKLNSGSGGKGSSSSTAAAVDAGAADFDLVGYMEALQAQRRADAEAAFARARDALNSAYSQASSSYGNIYNSGVGQLGKSYDNSRNKINQEAEDAFRQAYVNKMMEQKNMAQRLAAMGLSGGASETTLAKLATNYGNARNSIQRSLDTNLADLEQKYGANLADLYNAYQTQMAGIASQRASQLANLEMQLANLNANMGGDYYSALMSNQGLLKNAMQNAVKAQAAYSAPQAIEATNAYNPVSVKQATDMGSTATNWSAWQQELQRQLANGSNLNGAIAALKDWNVDPTELAKYVTQLTAV